MTPPKNATLKHQHPSMSSNYPSSTTESIDYDELDDEIADLVYLMNTFCGVQTRFSCAGHSSSGFVAGYIQFRAESLPDLVHLLDHLPHSSFGFNRPVYRGSQLNVRYQDDLQFTLHLGGKDKSVQREWLRETEAILRDTCPLCRKNGRDL